MLASLLLYLNDEWRREWGADTLFLDGQTDTGARRAGRPAMGDGGAQGVQGRALRRVVHRASWPPASLCA